MLRPAALLLPLCFLPQDPAAPGRRLDPSTAFFAPGFAVEPRSLAQLAGGPIDSETYQRYLAARVGTRYLEDLAFDLALARECAARGLARSAPVLARGASARRLFDSGRDAESDAQRLKFQNEALRDQRVEALVRADRQITAAELRALFERRYGQDGVRIRIRHVLVSFAASRRRLEQAGAPPTTAEVEAAAAARAAELRARIRAGEAFEDLLRASDDPTTRRQLRDRDRAADAGLLAEGAFRRSGRALVDAVADAAVGDVVGPIRTEQGLHLVRLEERTVTRWQDVVANLERHLRASKPSPGEVAALRQRLLAQFGYREGQ